jgi:release factor glutamine methyltransferase
LNGVDGSVELLAGDINDKTFVPSLGIFDCVVSNPPYVSEDEASQLQPEVIEFEPHIALFCPEGPLGFFESILGFSPLILKAGGLLAVEMPAGHSTELIEAFSTDFVDVEITKDLAGIDRVLTAVYSVLS